MKNLPVNLSELAGEAPLVPGAKGLAPSRDSTGNGSRLRRYFRGSCKGEQLCRGSFN
jgi:hypothetical protein